MESRASLVYAYLLLAGLDPREVRRGQLLTILTALAMLVVLWVWIMLLTKI